MLDKALHHRDLKKNNLSHICLLVCGIFHMTSIARQYFCIEQFMLYLDHYNMDYIYPHREIHTLGVEHHCKQIFHHSLFRKINSWFRAQSPQGPYVAFTWKIDSNKPRPLLILVWISDKFLKIETCVLAWED